MFARSAELSFALKVLAEPAYDAFALARGLPPHHLEGVHVTDWLRDLLYTRYMRGGVTKSQLAVDFGFNPSAATYWIRPPDAARVPPESDRPNQRVQVPHVEIRQSSEDTAYPLDGADWSPLDRILLQIGWTLATIRIKDEYTGDRSDFYDEELDLYAKNLDTLLQTYPELRDLTLHLLHHSQHPEMRNLIESLDL